MVDISRQPAEWRMADWREFATKYLERAETEKDSGLRKQFFELARRHLEMAAAIGKNQIGRSVGHAGMDAQVNRSHSG
ncbi:MAG: hypothetical protein U0942_10375 [Parvibaculum sp.]|uniref:hypothetical protein n=1 Tax=Parvibaculum sp. TaxID=2024848 RepID=UPI002ABAEF3F|nr:hypothetical protein [Parvibaculum sp.]MDZ4381734.1 hypothetical protein [Parvibaculum sp.]